MTTTVPSAASATESTVSGWAAPYVTDFLSKGQALSASPYQAYTGQLTADASGLQQQAFKGLANLAVPTGMDTATQGAGQIAGQLQGAAPYNPAQFTTATWNAQQAPQYGNIPPPQFGGGANPPGATGRGDGMVATFPGGPNWNSQPAQFDGGVSHTFGGGANPPGATGRGDGMVATFPGGPNWNAQPAQTGSLVEQYMNPYLQASLAPQLQEAQRQADINRMNDASRLTKAGAYGGSRQAIMESEGRRNLMDIQGQITGRGYDTAYQNAMSQFNADQGRLLEAQRGTEASRQFGATHGLATAGKALDAYSTQSQLGLAGLNAQRGVMQDQLSAGATQRDITQQGITADMKQFEQERAYPYEMLQFQKELLSGLPISTSRSYTASGSDPLAAILTGAAAGGNLASLFGATS